MSIAPIAGTTDFTRDFQELITDYAWGTIWTRPGLDHRTRRLLVLTATAALGRWEEFRLHVRTGLAPRAGTLRSPGSAAAGGGVRRRPGGQRRVPHRGRSVRRETRLTFQADRTGRRASLVYDCHQPFSTEGTERIHARHCSCVDCQCGSDVRAGGADEVGKDVRHLPVGHRRRESDPLCLPVGRVGARRYGQSQPSRHGSHPGDAGRGWRHGDRSPDPDALPRRPRRRPAGAGQARHDQALRRSRAERRGARASAGFPGSVRRALCQGQAHRRQARRQAAGGGTRLANHHVGGEGDHDSAPGWREAQSGVCQLHAAPRVKSDPTKMASRWAASSRSGSSGRSISAICSGTRKRISCARTTWSGPVDLYIVSHHGIDPQGRRRSCTGCSRAWPSSRTAHERAARFRPIRRSTRRRASRTIGSCTGHTTSGLNTTRPASSLPTSTSRRSIAAVLTAPPGGGRGGSGGPPPAAAGAPPTPGAAPATASAAGPPPAGGAGAAPPASPGSAPAAAPVQPPPGAGQPPSRRQRVSRAWLHLRALPEAGRAEGAAAPDGAHRAGVPDQGFRSG